MFFMTDTMSMYRYSDHPDRNDRYYDASTSEAAEESARTILKMMLDFGQIKRYNDSAHSDEDIAKYSSLSREEINSIPDINTRMMVRAIQYNVFVDNLLAMLNDEKRYTLIHSFDPQNPDERALRLIRSKELSPTFYTNRHITTNAIYENATLVELLESESSISMVEVEIKVYEETGLNYYYIDGPSVNMVSELPV